MSIKNTITIIAFLLPSFFSAAQSSDMGDWFIYFGHHKFSKHWGLWTEGQYRNYNLLGDTEQLLARTALTYDFTNTTAQASMGYAFVRTGSYVPGKNEKRYFNEHRIYQQLLTTQRFGRLYIGHRYRVEERFLPDDFKMRFRYFLSMNLMLNKPSREPGALYLSAYDEIFLNDLEPVFDRNRLYGALGYVFRPQVRGEFGLMYQMFENRRRPQWQLVLFQNLDFSKQAD